ncbi:hypothetical protein BVX93_00515 [bacterium B13(2017)]|nr:hypothetical protein BVX93_00515 [bacterium B13(2017)]
MRKLVLSLSKGEKFKNILGIIRAPFLLLTPSCVILGLAIAKFHQAHINIAHFVLALFGAIFAHISVNTFNEYFDYKSGLDFKTIKTPFSGGSGVLPQSCENNYLALMLALGSFILTSGIGVYFLFQCGLSLLIIGVFGLILIIFYTTFITKVPLLCLIAPGLGFGPLMVLGTYFVLTKQYSWDAFIISLVPFFLVNNLLLLNQFPDIEQDKSVGRKNIIIIYGARIACIIYGIIFLCAYSIILLKTSFLGLLTLPLGVMCVYGALRYNSQINKLIPYMALNVLIVLSTPILVAIGLFLG